jgi:hypothetical protein
MLRTRHGWLKQLLCNSVLMQLGKTENSVIIVTLLNSDCPIPSASATSTVYSYSIVYSYSGVNSPNLSLLGDTSTGPSSDIKSSLQAAISSNVDTRSSSSSSLPTLSNYSIDSNSSATSTKVDISSSTVSTAASPSISNIDRLVNTGNPFIVQISQVGNRVVLIHDDQRHGLSHRAPSTLWLLSDGTWTSNKSIASIFTLSDAG